jgi:replicative DNA helicase
MDYEAALISKVFSDSDLSKVFDERVKPELFVSYKKLWEFVLEVYSKHGGLPPKEEVENRFPHFDFVDTQDIPFSYISDELKKRHVHNILTDAMKEQAEKLKSKDPFSALEVMRSSLMKADLEARPSHDINFTEDFEERKKLFQRASEAAGVTGIPTPWPCLDEATQGFHEEDLIMIAGRGGIGKSWFSFMLAVDNWQNGAVPLIFSREMAVWQVTRRLDALNAKLPYRRFKNGTLSSDEEARWHKALADMKGGKPFWITGDDGDGHIGVTAIKAKIHRYRPDIVYIDGAYLIQDDRGGKQQWERFSNVCQDLKRLAQKESLPIVVTHQFNTSGKGMDGSEDTLKYGDVQMWFDLIIGCYQSEELRDNKEMLFKIVKHREGEKLQWVSEWDLDKMSFLMKHKGEKDTEDLDVPYDEEAPMKF